MLKKGEMYINNTDVYDYNARLVSYKIGGTKITQNYITATNPVVPSVFSQAIGTRTLTVTLSFECSGDSNIKRMSNNLAARSVVDAIFIKSTPVTLKMPDGFNYTSILTNVSEVTPDLSDSIEVTYTFEAIMHEERKILSSEDKNIVFDRDGTSSTAAILRFVFSTDTKAQITLSTLQNDNTYTVVSLFEMNNIKANREIIVDGENKKVTYEEVNHILDTTIIDFPLLISEKMKLTINCDGNVSTRISYLPTYI